MSNQFDPFFRSVQSRFSNMHSRLVLYTLLMMMITLPIMGLISYSISYSTTRSLQQQINERQIKDLSGNVDLILDNMRNITDLIALNEQVQELLAIDNRYKSDIEKIRLNNKLNGAMSVIRSSSFDDRFISALYIFGVNGVNYFTDGTMLLPGANDDSRRIGRSSPFGELSRSGNNFLPFTVAEYPEDDLTRSLKLRFGSTLFMASSIKDAHNHLLGYMLLALNETYLQRNFESSGEDSITFILNGKRLVWASESAANEDFKLNIKLLRQDAGAEPYYDKGRLWLSTRLKTSGWTLVRANTDRDYASRMKAVLITTLEIVSIAFVVVVGAAFYVSKLITRSGQRLSRMLHWTGRMEDLSLIKLPSKKRLSFFTFKHKLVFYFAIIILLPSVLLITVSISLNNHVIRAIKTSQWEKTMFQAAGMMDINLLDRSFVLDSLFTSTELQSILSGDERDNAAQRNSDRIKEIIYNTNYVKYNIIYLNVYDRAGKLLYSTLGRYNNDYIDAERKIEVSRISGIDDGKIHWLSGYTDIYNNRVFAAAREIKDFYGSRNNHFPKIGYVVMTFNESMLEEFYRGLLVEPNMDASIVDSRGRILSNMDKSIIGSDRNRLMDFNGLKKSAVLLTQDASITDWKLQLVVPVKDLIADNKQITFLNLLLLGLCVLIYLGFALSVSKKFASPIEKLLKGIKEMQNGEAAAVLETPDKNMRLDEFVELAYSFNALVNRLKELIHEVYESRIHQNDITLRWKEAELKALHMQINPHFLYNTLDSIRCKAMFLSGGKNEVSEMIQSLSQMLRFSIRTDTEIIPIREEIGNVKDYVRIQKLRYEDKLDVEWDVDDGLLDHSTIKLILQPIVENAISHGLERKKEKGKVGIRLFREDNTIKFEIKDDGLGIPAHTMASLRKTLEGDSDAEHGLHSDGLRQRIGLFNVHQRIRLHYGLPYGIMLTSDFGSGAQVTLTIPADKGE